MSREIPPRVAEKHEVTPAVGVIGSPVEHPHIALCASLPAGVGS